MRFSSICRPFPVPIAILLAACASDAPPEIPEVVKLRIATFNIEDVRTADLLNPDQPRLQAAAAIIQQIRPDILLINEFAYDQPETEGYQEAAGPGQNGRRFATHFLGTSQGNGLEPLGYRAFSAPSNTGIPSGFDLDNNGVVSVAPPRAAPSDSTGAPPRQTNEDRLYGGDSWGFGAFPGQYAMTLLVREDIAIVYDDVQTFQNLLWNSLPGAMKPTDPKTGEPWYSDEEWQQFRLTSKSHWIVPLRLPGGQTVSVICSHPTPPAFDGPEMRNKKRNHDEIRLIADLIDGAAHVIDDRGRPVSALDRPFVILGDLNADPDEGSSIANPIASFLFAHPRVQSTVVPVADSAGQAMYPDLDADDTSKFGMRVDYVLPSTDFDILGSGLFRFEGGVSDHFPVWVDVQL